MITQYPWASVKAQERKHIEIGIMVTMLLGITTFYFVPSFGSEVVFEEAYTAPPLDVVSIPATVQPPELTKPMAPAIPVPVEDEPEMDIDVMWDVSYEPGLLGTLEPPAPPMPVVPIWQVEIKPVPVGGYVALKRSVVYPTIAREAGIEGTVVVKATIGKDGRVKDAFIQKGYPKTGLDEAALKAVMGIKWSPAYQRDKPVTVEISIPIIFQLRKG